MQTEGDESDNGEWTMEKWLKELDLHDTAVSGDVPASMSGVRVMWD